MPDRGESAASEGAAAAGQLMAGAIKAADTVNERGQQEGYRYVAIQWQGGVSKIVGGSSTTPIIWPKPKWT